MTTETHNLEIKSERTEEGVRVVAECSVCGRIELEHRGVQGVEEASEESSGEVDVSEGDIEVDIGENDFVTNPTVNSVENRITAKDNPEITYGEVRHSETYEELIYTSIRDNAETFEDIEGEESITGFPIEKWVINMLLDTYGVERILISEKATNMIYQFNIRDYKTGYEVDNPHQDTKQLVCSVRNAFSSNGSLWDLIPDDNQTEVGLRGDD